MNDCAAFPDLYSVLNSTKSSNLLTMTSQFCTNTPQILSSVGEEILNLI